MKNFYLAMTVLGLVVPYAVFISWINSNGLNISLLLLEISDSKISLFAWLDVIISAVVLIGFILFEAKRLEMKKIWIPILGTLTVGVSFGLPLFLYMRENYKKVDK